MNSNQQPSGRLISHFANRCAHGKIQYVLTHKYVSADTLLIRARDSQSTGWSELWETNESDLWDRGKPSPALIDFIESCPAVLPKPENGRRLRALVPVLSHPRRPTYHILVLTRE